MVPFAELRYGAAEDAVRAGSLRQDLYYRLQAGVLHVPPLRERSDDVPLLVEHFIEFFNEKLQPRIPLRGIEEGALAAMLGYSWPGNLRELSNSIEGAFTFGRSPMIRLQDLPDSSRVTAQKSAQRPYACV
jgi:transcriptional regulator with PAS, ATPase and Fis domain